MPSPHENESQDTQMISLMRHDVIRGTRNHGGRRSLRIWCPIWCPNTWYLLVLVGTYWDSPQLRCTNESQRVPIVTSTFRIRIPLGAPTSQQPGSHMRGGLTCIRRSESCDQEAQVAVAPAACKRSASPMRTASR